jgi:4-hydroxybenzoate polyprenyltransferase
VAAALRLSIVSHAVTMALLVGLGVLAGLAWPYWLGMLVVAGLLAYEHSLVRSDDLSRVDVAFFNVNGLISVTLLASVLAALYLPAAGA